MVLLSEVNKDDYDVAMPPFYIERKNVKYAFPPPLTYPIESSMPFKEGDYEKMIEWTLEKRSDWLGQWRPRYSTIIRYRVSYRHVGLTSTLERTKQFYYLYYWRDSVVKNGDSCAEDIISLNSCEEFWFNKLPPTVKWEATFAFVLKIRKYEIQTKVHEFSLGDSTTTYFLRCENAEEFEHWTNLIQSVVTCHSYRLYRKQYRAGDFRTIEIRKISTTMIDGVAATTFPAVFGFEPVEQEMELTTQGGVVGNYPKKLRGKDDQ